MSSQEVKVFTSFCKDPSMYEVFAKGHDLYSTVASTVYGLPYNLCKEFKDNLSPIDKTILEIEVDDNIILYADDILTLSSGEQKLASLLKIGDILETDNSPAKIISIKTEDSISYEILISK